MNATRIGICSGFLVTVASLFAGTAGAFAGTAGASADTRPLSPEETVTCAVDLPAWVRSQFATVRTPPIESGSIDNLFDRNLSTMAVLNSDGAAVVEFFFREPIAVHQVGLAPCRGAPCRWEAWFAPAPDTEGRYTFLPLIEKRTARGGQRDRARLDQPAQLRALRLVIDGMTAEKQRLLSEIEIEAAVAITGLEVHWPDAPLVAGGAYRIGVNGLDAHGGRTPISAGLQWTLFPKKNILAITKDNVARAIAPGKVEVRVTFGAIKHGPAKLTVKEPDAAPGGIAVSPFATTAAVRTDFAVPEGQTLLIYRREDGKPQAALPHHRTPVGAFNDFGLQPGSIWHYSAALANVEGIAVTQRTAEQRTQFIDPPSRPLCAAANLEILVAIYGEEMTPETEAALREGFELARTFYFRNSFGKLNVDLCPVRLRADVTEERGPLFYMVEYDLGRRGLLDQGIDVIHVAGTDMDLNCGGACFGNGAAVSFGSSAAAPAPFVADRAHLNACWSFVHEFQHSLQAVIDAARDEPSMLRGHFAENYPLPESALSDENAVFDAGGAYDGQAAILRRYDGYDDLPAPWNGRIEAIDGDGDGLPDDDPRWPIDEKRFGTDPANADSDGDGLDDLAEFCAGIYAAAEPLDPDTDGDGVSDGCDPFPLSTFRGRIEHGTPPDDALPGTILSRDVSFRSAPGAPDDLRVLASWDETALYLGFDGTGPLAVTIHLDGSGALGAFASDVAVASAGSDRRGSDVYTAESALRVVYAESVLYKGRTAVAGSRVDSWQSGERWRIRVKIPAALGPGTNRCHINPDARPAAGLVLEEGRVLGVNFTARALKANGQSAPTDSEGEFSGDWTAVYELHRFYDARLVPAEK